MLTLLGVCLKPGKPICIVTDFVEGGSLEGKLHDSKFVVDWLFIVKTVKGIAAGMYHLQQEGLVHRDLAARNVLLTGAMTPMVCDFGLSTKGQKVGELSEGHLKISQVKVKETGFFRGYTTFLNPSFRAPLSHLLKVLTNGWHQSLSPTTSSPTRVTCGALESLFGKSSPETFLSGSWISTRQKMESLTTTSDFPSTSNGEILKLNFSVFFFVNQFSCRPPKWKELLTLVWQTEADKRPDFVQIDKMLGAIEEETLFFMKQQSQEVPSGVRTFSNN